MGEAQAHTGARPAALSARDDNLGEALRRHASGPSASRLCRGRPRAASDAVDASAPRRRQHVVVRTRRRARSVLDGSEVPAARPRRASSATRRRRTSPRRRADSTSISAPSPAGPPPLLASRPLREDARQRVAPSRAWRPEPRARCQCCRGGLEQLAAGLRATVPRACGRLDHGAPHRRHRSYDRQPVGWLALGELHWGRRTEGRLGRPAPHLDEAGCMPRARAGSSRTVRRARLGRAAMAAEERWHARRRDSTAVSEPRRAYRTRASTSTSIVSRTARCPRRSTPGAGDLEAGHARSSKQLAHGRHPGAAPRTRRRPRRAGSVGSGVRRLACVLRSPTAPELDIVVDVLG